MTVCASSWVSKTLTERVSEWVLGCVRGWMSSWSWVQLVKVLCKSQLFTWRSEWVRKKTVEKNSVWFFYKRREQGARQVRNKVYRFSFGNRGESGKQSPILCAEKEEGVRIAKTVPLLSFKDGCLKHNFKSTDVVIFSSPQSGLCKKRVFKHNKRLVLKTPDFVQTSQNFPVFG